MSDLGDMIGYGIVRDFRRVLLAAIAVGILVGALLMWLIL